MALIKGEGEQIAFTSSLIAAFSPKEKELRAPHLFGLAAAGSSRGSAEQTKTPKKGSAQYVDPSAGGGLYYRIAPVPTPASY